MFSICAFVIMWGGKLDWKRNTEQPNRNNCGIFGCLSRQLLRFYNWVTVNSALTPSFVRPGTWFWVKRFQPLGAVIIQEPTVTTRAFVQASLASSEMCQMAPRVFDDLAVGLKFVERTESRLLILFRSALWRKSYSGACFWLWLSKKYIFFIKPFMKHWNRSIT